MDGIWQAMTSDIDGWLDAMVAQIELSEATLEVLDEDIAELKAQLKEAPAVEPPDYCPNYMPPSLRAQETARLHVKGGWRDHTDGNRIVTTRGDKLEVVGGNYRMLVMGRVQHQFNPGGEEVFPGWDISGGHVGEHGISTAVMSEYPLPAGAVSDTKIEWVKNWAGTWKVKETTIRGDSESTTTGDSIARQYGKLQQSFTGTPKPNATHPNPVNQSKTWLESTHSYTGSAKYRVPLMTDESWVNQMISTSEFDSSTDITVAKRTTSTTTVETMVDKTVARDINTTTMAQTMNDTTIGERTTSLTRGNSESYTLGTASDLTIGNSNDISVGASDSLTVGAASEVTVGATGSLTLGMTHDITLAASSEISITGSADISIGPALEVSAGISIELTPVRMSKIGLQVIT